MIRFTIARPTPVPSTLQAFQPLEDSEDPFVVIRLDADPVAHEEPALLTPHHPSSMRGCLLSGPRNFTALPTRS